MGVRQEDGKIHASRGWADEASITWRTTGERYATSLAGRVAVVHDSAGRMINVQIDGSIGDGVGRDVNMAPLADLLVQLGEARASSLDVGDASLAVGARRDMSMALLADLRVQFDAVRAINSRLEWVVT